MTARDTSVMNSSSCSPAWPALACSRRPRYCPAMTAPPVASAENALTSRTFTVSTNETAEMAASPTWDTITESQSPTVMAQQLLDHQRDDEPVQVLLCKFHRQFCLFHVLASLMIK